MKPIVKEILIILLLLLVIVLGLCVLLYDYIPINQVVPTVSKYEPTQEVKQALKEIATDDTSKVILTYEISKEDLGVYESTKNYNKGKVNPFSSYESGTSSNNSNIESNSSNGGTTNNTQEQSTNTNLQNTNNIDKGSNDSEVSNNFYEDNGTK